MINNTLSDYKTIEVNALKQFAFSVFQFMGCNTEDAKLASEVLVQADLRGIDSHGVARLSGYLRLWEKGRINPKPNIKVMRQTASTATLDGDAGLGLVIAPKAMDLAIQKAKHVEVVGLQLVTQIILALRLTMP